MKSIRHPFAALVTVDVELDLDKTLGIYVPLGHLESTGREQCSIHCLYSREKVEMLSITRRDTQHCNG